ncbi:MAG: S1 RNA-binding domain-containing protein, partial [Candidatus Aenigmatarchaeota archaeon]
TYGIVSGIADFGVFLNIGPIDGLVHISQVMDDEVSISGKEALVGKKTNKVLKIGDIVKARIITVSYKDITNIRVSLTMKQPGLGKIEWLEEKSKKK